VDVGEARESLDGGGEALGKGFGGVLDFSRVEGSNSADLESSTNLCRQSEFQSALSSFMRYALRLRSRKAPGGRGKALCAIVSRKAPTSSGSWKARCPETPGSWAQRGCPSTGSSFWRLRVLMSSKAVCALERLQGKKVHDAIDTGGENRRLAAALVPHPLLASFVRAVATIHHAPDNTIAHIFTIMFSKSRSTFEPQGSALSCGR